MMKIFNKNYYGHCVLAPHVVFLPVQDGSARVLDLNGEFYTLSSIGATMLSSALRSDLDSAIEKIVDIYGVDPAKVKQDASNLIYKLQQKGIIINRISRYKLFIWNSMALLISAPFLFAIRLFIWHRKIRIWLLLLLSKVSFFVFGWERTVHIWGSCWRLEENRAINNVDKVLKDTDIMIHKMASSHIFQMQCKERSLCCWAITRLAGIRTKLVVGVQVFPLGGHCWCEFQDAILTDTQAQCDNYTALRIYQ